MAVRRTVIFSGHVQGVNFRRSTARVAQGYPVTGTVRNEPDGTVRLIAEGAEDVLDAFLHDVNEVMDDYITDQLDEQSTATNEFERFAILTR